MKFALDYAVDIQGQNIRSAALPAQLDTHRGDFGPPSALEGTVILTLEGDEHDLDISEPLVRLVDALLRKLRWVIGGDVETVALRNSEQCFAFSPSGEAVEVAFFNGPESEIDDYVVEPATVRLDHVATQIIAVGERLVDLVRALDAGALSSDEDCQALVASLRDARDAWKEHQRQRR